MVGLTLADEQWLGVGETDCNGWLSHDVLD